MFLRNNFKEFKLHTVFLKTDLPIEFRILAKRILYIWICLLVYDMYPHTDKLENN